VPEGAPAGMVNCRLTIPLVIGRPAMYVECAVGPANDCPKGSTDQAGANGVVSTTLPPFGVRITELTCEGVLPFTSDHS